MISWIHRQLVSTKAEWRTDETRRCLPAMAVPILFGDPIPLPQQFGSIAVSKTGEVVSYVRERRKVAQLKPGEPLRVILNHRKAYNSGQYYTVEDHYLLWRKGVSDLFELRTKDLQIDLW